MKENHASSTAYTVLQGILYVAGEKTHAGLVSPEIAQTCQNMLAASDEGNKRLRQLDNRLVRKLLPLAEALIMPKISLHYVLRKRYIEDHTRRCLRDGVTQVINFGAGFDTLACRLAAEFPAVRFIEFDHPATHQDKVHALAQMGAHGSNLHCVAVDFATRNMRDVLETTACIDLSQPTLCIVEGVLMYLDAAQVRAFLESLKRFEAETLRIIFTAAQPAELCRHAYGLALKWYLKAKGEPLAWVCPKQDIAAFLAPIDYTVIAVAGSDAFREQYLHTGYRGILHDGEFITVAEFSTSRP